MLTIAPIPAFDDNYIWLIFDQASRQAFVVDPGDATPVLETLQKLELNLSGVLITHHHFDHVGGLAALRAKFDPLVFGPRNPAIDGISEALGAGDSIEVLGHNFEVLEVPGHTLDHIAYWCADAPLGPLLFCGDTLFAGGCGRVFEGTPPMMYHSLQKLAALPPATRVYCAHEYTLANLGFALAVEPDNNALQQRLEKDRQCLSQGQPTVPSTLADEFSSNPFLRCSTETVRLSAQAHTETPLHSPAEIFSVIRRWKDSF